MRSRRSVTPLERHDGKALLRLTAHNANRLLDPAEAFESSALERHSLRALEEDTASVEFMDKRQLLFSTFVELVPMPFCEIACRMYEGAASAANRKFSTFGSKGADLLVDWLFKTLLFWLFLALYLGWGGSEVHWADIIAVGLLKLYRAVCIGIKYAYFAPSEMECVTKASRYNAHGRVFRQLGSAAYFDSTGSFRWDVAEHMLESALQNGLFSDGFLEAGFDLGCGSSRSSSSGSSLTLEDMERRYVGAAFVRCARGMTASFFNSEFFRKTGFVGLRFEQVWHSKHGNVFRLFGLDEQSLRTLEASLVYEQVDEKEDGSATECSANSRNPAEVGTAEDSASRKLLPLPVALYVLLSIGFRPAKPNLRWVFTFGLFFASICPIFRFLQSGGDCSAAFGQSERSHLMYGIRFWLMFSCVISPIYLLFPVYDCYMRWRMSLVLLVFFGGDPVKRSELAFREPESFKEVAELNPLGSNLLRSPGDLVAYWMLVRTCGATYMAGLVSRYNNGFSTLNLVMLLMLTGVAVFQIRAGEIYWPFFAELGILFILSALSMCATIFFGQACNNNMRQLGTTVLHRAVLRHRRIQGPVEPPSTSVDARASFVEVAADVSADLARFHDERPLTFLYMNASPELARQVYGFCSLLASTIMGTLIATGKIPITFKQG